MSKSMFEKHRDAIVEAEREAKKAESQMRFLVGQLSFTVEGKKLAEVVNNDVVEVASHCISRDVAAALGRWLIYWTGLYGDHPACPRCGAYHTTDGPRPPARVVPIDLENGHVVPPAVAAKVVEAVEAATRGSSDGGCYHKEPA